MASKPKVETIWFPSSVRQHLVPIISTIDSTALNVSRMLPKLLQTQPHIVENWGITKAPLFLSLTS